MKYLKNIAFLITCLYGLSSQCQDLAYNGNPDTSFFTARDLAFGGNGTVARDTLRHILTKYPNYTDVRNLLAKTLSWDKKYNDARREFNKITSVERKNKEVWVATIKNELYAQEYYIALGLANKALIYLPKDSDLEALRQQALKGTTSESPMASKETKTLEETSENTAFNNAFGISNAFEIFDIVYEPMLYTSLEYQRETRAGKIIPRLNYGNRFEIQGLQYEVDFYPRFSKKFYGYLNYGISKSVIFPNHRVGAELFVNWPKHMEISLGMRYLDFDNVKANIITASAALYHGNYYFSIRPYFLPNVNKGSGFSGNLLARKYFKDGSNFLGINIGMGYSPELRQLQDGDELLAETVLYIESQQAILEYQFSGKKNPNLYRANLGLGRQELVFESGRFFWVVSAGIAYQVKF
ncbi:YaiO family outer membrane beta-barrel protein [Ulvibacterium sp.]|uniref:YaiO family outer membrane beta-barrel protein n=1 Tax=Ulvibacterium sp. TaxID=2665914 RepID=UPI00261AC972|nr:YaiO family outer membrane beta-barrel protein [Ulvibacterium sp.]